MAVVTLIAIIFLGGVIIGLIGRPEQRVVIALEQDDPDPPSSGLGWPIFMIIVIFVMLVATGAFN